MGGCWRFVQQNKNFIFCIICYGMLTEIMVIYFQRQGNALARMCRKMPQKSRYMVKNEGSDETLGRSGRVRQILRKGDPVRRIRFKNKG